MKPIPERWIPYKACGKVIEGTRIVCFKVPLKRSVQTGVSEITEIWDIPALLEKLPNLGAVVDLTNTARYYNPIDLKKQGVVHKKILMPGRIIPPEAKVAEFMNAVDDFLGKNCHALLGVHCTHGLNRTGYMVCRYLRDRMGMSGKEAISKFEKARGYKIERDNFIADIVGNQPPPPHMGGNTNTTLKVVERRHSMQYRSPLGNQYQDDYGSRTPYFDIRNRYSGGMPRERRGGYSGYRQNSQWINPRFSYNSINPRDRSENRRGSGSLNDDYDFTADYY